MNLDTYLRIKQAYTVADDDFARKLYLGRLSPEQRIEYSKYKPHKPGRIWVNNKSLPGRVRAIPFNDYTGDTKARRITFGTGGFKDFIENGKKYTGIGIGSADISPLENLKYGDPIGHVNESLTRTLMGKGYGGHELRNIDDIYLFGVKGDDASKLYAPGKLNSNGRPTTVWFDDKGNIVDRSKGIVKGRRIGRLAGGSGGAVLGAIGANALANSLGLTTDEDSTTVDNFVKGMANGVVTLGGGAGGMYLGGKYGNLLGEYIGGKIDPQKGTPIKMYSPKYPKPLNLLRVK